MMINHEVFRVSPFSDKTCRTLLYRYFAINGYKRFVAGLLAIELNNPLWCIFTFWDEPRLPGATTVSLSGVAETRHRGTEGLLRRGSTPFGNPWASQSNIGILLSKKVIEPAKWGVVSATLVYF
jgi:hypothetical protein